MPVIHVDTEQAELVEVAISMLEAALTARTRRADPDKIISNSLTLQASKLATVRQLLSLPEPPPYSQLSPALRELADNLLWRLHTGIDGAEKDATFERLRGVLVAPAFPTPGAAGHIEVPPVPKRRTSRKTPV